MAAPQCWLSLNGRLAGRRLGRDDERQDKFSQKGRHRPQGPARRAVARQSAEAQGAIALAPYRGSRPEARRARFGQGNTERLTQISHSWPGCSEILFLEPSRPMV